MRSGESTHMTDTSPSGGTRLELPDRLIAVERCGRVAPASFDCKSRREPFPAVAVVWTPRQMDRRHDRGGYACDRTPDAGADRDVAERVEPLARTHRCSPRAAALTSVSSATGTD